MSSPEIFALLRGSGLDNVYLSENGLKGFVSDSSLLQLGFVWLLDPAARRAIAGVLNAQGPSLLQERMLPRAKTRRSCFLGECVWVSCDSLESLDAFPELYWKECGACSHMEGLGQAISLSSSISESS